MTDNQLGNIKFKIYPQFKKDFFLDVIKEGKYNIYLQALGRVPLANREQLLGYIDLDRDFEEMVKDLERDTRKASVYRGGNSEFEKRSYYIIEYYQNDSDEVYIQHSLSYLKNTFPFLSTVQINDVFSDRRGNHNLLKTVLYFYDNIKFGNSYDIYLENTKIPDSEGSLSYLDPAWVKKGGNFHFIEEVNLLEEDAWSYWEGKEDELKQVAEND